MVGVTGVADYFASIGKLEKERPSDLSGNTKGGSITVLLTSCLTGLD